MSHDGIDEAARARAAVGDAPVDSAPATIPGGDLADEMPASAPALETRKPTLPPSPPTVPRPTTARSRLGASQPPPASPSQPATARHPPGAAPSAHARTLSVPPAPRAPHIEPYDSEATTDYDPFGDDAPTIDYDPRARGIYSHPSSGSGLPPAPSTLPASAPPRAMPASGPPQMLASSGEHVERSVPSSPPRTIGTSPASGPPSSQKRRSSRRAVPLPTDGVERVVTVPRPASVPPPAAAGFEPQGETPAFAPFDEATIIKPMRILSIGSEPPAQARMPTPARARPALLDSPPQPPTEPRAEALQVDGIGSPPLPRIAPSAHQDLEHGWTPLPAVVAESQETVRLLPAVTEAMMVESGFAPVAPPAAPRSGDVVITHSQADVPHDLRRTQQMRRPSPALLDPLEARDGSAPESESEPEDFEVIEEQPPVRPAPPPPPPKTARPVTSPGSAGPITPVPVSAPVAAAPPAPSAPPPVREKSPSLPALVDEGGVKKPRPWWEDLFGDDYLRTLDRLDAKHVKREVDFIEESLGLERGAVILDLACGEGQHAVDLASRGYSVVGFDLSLPMLARAADEAQDKNQKINFLHGDMREMQFEEMFDGIYCWSTSFGFFDDERNVEVLQRIHRALRVGGNFLLDVVNRDYVSPRAPSLVWFEGEGCTCMDDMHVDFFTSRLRVKRTAMFDDGHSRELDYSIRLYALHELGKMLHETGFKVVEVTGHHAHPGVFFGAESPRMIILAERA